MLPTAAAAEVLDVPPEIDVLFIGERHDNPTHHRNQADTVAALAPAALVFEMIEPRHALAASRLDRDDADALQAALEWEARGWPAFGLYAPIFAAAPGAALFGGALPPEVVRAAVESGAAAQMPGAKLFGLDRPLHPDEAAARVELQADAHCDALPDDLLPGMVEAQRLRDAAIARAVIAARAETGGLVVVITGNGHARTDWGAPALLARAEPGLAIHAVGQLELEAPEGQPFDATVSTPPVVRPDPCTAFER